MSRKYKIVNQHQPYFISCSVINWRDAFKVKQHTNILIDSLRFCQKNKGLIIYAWCFMYTHIHLIIGTKDQSLQDIIRDFKSYTSRHIRKEMFKNINDPRICTMCNQMVFKGSKNKNNNDWQFWQQHNHPQELFSPKVAEQKLNYLHNNPVKAGYVDTPQNWLYSSAIDYVGGKGLIDISFLR